MDQNADPMGRRQEGQGLQGSNTYAVVICIQGEVNVGGLVKRGAGTKQGDRDGGCETRLHAWRGKKQDLVWKEEGATPRLEWGWGLQK